MKQNLIREKTYAFSVRIVNMARELKKRKTEQELVHQLIKSGTSIGANVSEAVAGISKNEFSMKISIAYKEAKETEYWLTLLHDTGAIRDKEFFSIYHDLEPILRILWAILKTTRMKKQ